MRSSQLGRKCRTMRLHRDGFDHFWKATRINALRTLFRLNEASNRCEKETQSSNTVIHIDATLHNYYLNIFKDSRVFIDTNIFSRLISKSITHLKKEKNYAIAISLIFWSNVTLSKFIQSKFINRSIFCINKKKKTILDKEKEWKKDNGERNVLSRSCSTWYFEERRQIDERRGVGTVSRQLAGPGPTHLSSLPWILSNKKE